MQSSFNLYCPRCKEQLHGLWFLQSNTDTHGIYSCSACVSWFARVTKRPRSTWQRIASQKDYCKHSKVSWQQSRARSEALVESEREAAASRQSERKKTRKRKRAVCKRDEQSEDAASAAPAAAATTPAATNENWEQLKGRVIAAVKYQILAAAAKHDISIEVAKQLTANIDLSGFKGA